MHEFKHPKYYKELRKRNKELQAATRDLAGAHSDQVISDEASTEATSVHPGPGLKQQAASDKPQASASTKPQAASSKPCGARVKPQATSVKLLD